MWVCLRASLKGSQSVLQKRGPQEANASTLWSNKHHQVALTQASVAVLLVLTGLCLCCEDNQSCARLKAASCVIFETLPLSSFVNESLGHKSLI